MSSESTSKKKIRIGICQFESLPPPKRGHEQGETTDECLGDHAARNLGRAKEFVAQAAEAGAELVVFPEYFITGIIENDLHLAAKETRWLDEFQQLAVTHGVDILPGTIVEQTADSGELFNTAYYVSKDGQILAHYRKKNLWHSEKYLTPCERAHEVFLGLGGTTRIGMLICWDLAWPEAFRDLMKQGVEVILVPSYWTLDGPESKMRVHDPSGANEGALIDGLVISRALEAEACVVFVNCAGSKEDGFLGRSAVCMPLKGPLVALDRPDEQLAIVDVDLGLLSDAKEVYKVSHEYPSKPFYSSEIVGKAES